MLRKRLVFKVLPLRGIAYLRVGRIEETETKSLSKTSRFSRLERNRQFPKIVEDGQNS